VEEPSFSPSETIAIPAQAQGGSDPAAAFPVVGVAVGAAVFLIAICALMIICLVMKRNKQDPEVQQPLTVETLTTDYTG
jgi:hypothetical protein